MEKIDKITIGYLSLTFFIVLVL